jgi:hypothetical protein
MKILAIFTVLIALCLESKAGEFEHLGSQITAPWATVFTNAFTFTTNATAGGVSVTNAFQADKAIYHTFVFADSFLGTNQCQVYVDSSIDSMTWVNVYSNTLANGADSEYQFTGESVYFQERIGNILATNGTIIAQYAAH